MVNQVGYNSSYFISLVVDFFFFFTLLDWGWVLFIGLVYLLVFNIPFFIIQKVAFEALLYISLYACTYIMHILLQLIHILLLHTLSFKPFLPFLPLTSLKCSLIIYSCPRFTFYGAHTVPRPLARNTGQKTWCCVLG